MRLTPALLAMMIVFGGCTSSRLRKSVVTQAGTLTELQYEQVLGNLAMLHDNPTALPSMVNIRDGSSQIQDLGSATATLFLDAHNNLPPNIAGSRTVVQQWGLRPVADDTELKLIRLAYQRALGSNVSLQFDHDFANDLAHELKNQIAQPDAADVRLEDKLLADSLELALRDPHASRTGLATNPPAAGGGQNTVRPSVLKTGLSPQLTTLDALPQTGTGSPSTPGESPYASIDDLRRRFVNSGRPGTTTTPAPPAPSSEEAPPAPPVAGGNAGLSQPSRAAPAGAAPGGAARRGRRTSKRRTSRRRPTWGRAQSRRAAFDHRPNCRKRAPPPLELVARSHCRLEHRFDRDRQ